VMRSTAAQRPAEKGIETFLYTVTVGYSLTTAAQRPAEKGIET